MLFTSASIISLLAVVPSAVKAVPVFPHSDGLLPRQAADIQSILAVDPSQVATGSEQDGQGADVADNQVRSKTSFNNFANFCLTQKDVPLTDGQQLKGGSCNPTIMGVIASTNNMPRSRFIFPKNGQVIQSNTPFTLQMKIANLQTGNFVNPNTNYYAAPQTVNGAGDIVGHSHVTIQKMDKFDQPDPLDPSVFAFFKGFNNVANGGILTADVPAPGLPDGFYRMCSINTAANHQPVLVAVAQHGSLDDCVYFQCAAKASDTPFFNAGANTAGAGNNGNNNGNGNGNGNNGGKGGDKTASSSAAPPASTSNGNGNNGGKGGDKTASSSAAAPSASNNAGGNKGGNNGNKGGAQGNNGNNGNNGQKGGAQANNGGANNNNNKGQAAQQAADQAKQAADAKKAAEDQKKAQDAAKAAAGANSKQAAAQQAADKAKQAADAKKAAEDQKKAQQQSNKGGQKNRRALRFQRD
jgi:hypothetical protein